MISCIFTRITFWTSGFQKAHSTQHALFELLQAWQKELNNSGFIATILIDLSKAYNCLPQDLITATLGGNGHDRTSLGLLMNYLNSRKQRTKVVSSYCKWAKIKRGIPQGSILGTLLLNIFINDLFFVIENSDTCSFVDDNTLYSCGANLKTVIRETKLNPEKFQFMIVKNRINLKNVS